MSTPQHANEPAAAYAPVPEPFPGPLPAGVDADIQGSWAAMRRAAQRARQVAQQTGTDLIVLRAGQVVRVAPQPKTDP